MLWSNKRLFLTKWFKHFKMTEKILPFHTTFKGRVVYNRPTHFYTFRDVDRIIAELTDSKRIPYKFKRGEMPDDFNPNSIEFIENCIKNLNEYLTNVTQSDEISKDFMDQVFDFFISILELFVPEWITTILKVLYRLSPKNPEDEISDSDIEQAIEDILDLLPIQITEEQENGD